MEYKEIIILYAAPRGNEDYSEEFMDDGIDIHWTRWITSRSYDTPTRPVDSY